MLFSAANLVDMSAAPLPCIHGPTLVHFQLNLSTFYGIRLLANHYTGATQDEILEHSDTRRGISLTLECLSDKNGSG